jgi:hypothetical protein
LTQIGEGTAPPFGFAGPLEPGSLEVTVVEERSGEPVAGVGITLRGPTSVSSVTGSDGRARFPELEPGLYWATATQEQFEIDNGTWLAIVSAGEAETMSLRITRILLTVVVKRAHVKGLWKAAIGDKGELEYGHWWIEIDEIESYGWWPARSVSVWETFTGVPGSLNGLRGIGGTPTTDAHDGHPAEEMFHPAVVNAKSAAAIKECIRAFAKGYSGSWSWPFGQNCHSFQEEMMEHCGLAWTSKEAKP